MNPVTIIISAVGVLCTILLAVGGMVWFLARTIQRSTDLNDAAREAIAGLPQALKPLSDKVDDHENILNLHHDTIHAMAGVTNSLNRRVAALEIVAVKQDPETLGVAQQAAADEDSAVHFVAPDGKERR